ncbi:hypothetical protein [Cardinium endosymbiont of Culicoides punctatus]|uniref:hypothetical protein n=1 Tax=Cardinium endosymbiont of Culicoides punctatus TaxID=2304601 RepID=UPI0010587587|nr:hypothetical protein [Cardinium endosymbiont of Culicoides punctatus]TDG95376.1 hypothetical protein CCPUN_04700 [Cardinium endosymbiont of Culicoides punctatus]
MQNKVLIFTTIDSGNYFTENFSCWYAGALEATGHSTEIIKLEHLAEIVANKLLSIQKEKLKTMQDVLLKAVKIILIVPEINNMLPTNVGYFTQFISQENRHDICHLVTIIIDHLKTKSPKANRKFEYPINDLDTLFGSSFRTNRIEIKNSLSGDMCDIFASFPNILDILIK